MASSRRLTGHEGNPAKRWLWYAVAYLLVILVLAVLARYVPAPTSPHFGWSD